VRGPLSVGPFDPCDGATGSAVTGVCAALLALLELELVLGVGRTGAAAVELVVLDVVLAGDAGGVGEAARCTTGWTGVLPALRGLGSAGLFEPCDGATGIGGRPGPLVADLALAGITRWIGSAMRLSTG
jgi:hypothetical protein